MMHSDTSPVHMLKRSRFMWINFGLNLDSIRGFTYIDIIQLFLKKLWVINIDIQSNFIFLSFYRMQIWSRFESDVKKTTFQKQSQKVSLKKNHLFSNLCLLNDFPKIMTFLALKIRLVELFLINWHRWSGLFFISLKS